MVSFPYQQTILPATFGQDLPELPQLPALPEAPTPAAPGRLEGAVVLGGAVVGLAGRWWGSASLMLLGAGAIAWGLWNFPYTAAFRHVAGSPVPGMSGLGRGWGH